MIKAFFVLKGSIDTCEKPVAERVKFPDFVANTATFVKQNRWLSIRSQRAGSQLDAATDFFGKLSIVGSYNERDMVFLVETKQ